MRIEYINTDSKLCTIRAHYSIGSALEYRSKKWSDGLAHVVEHMIYKQNENLHNELGLIGADWNGSTFYNEVMFIASAPSKNVLRLIRIFKELLVGNKFSEENLEKEKSVILEEEVMIRFDLSRNISLEKDKFLCKGFITKQIGGSIESIKGITLEEVQEFYDTYFTLDNLLLVVSGPPISEDIGKIFGKTNDLFIEPEFPANSFRTKKKKTKYFSQLHGGARIFISYPCEPAWSEQNMILNLISCFFSSGMDTRLFKKLRSEQGLVYSVSGGPYLYSDIGWYNIVAITQKHNVKKVIDSITEEVDNLKLQKITEEELIKSRYKELNYLYSLTETSYGKNSLITRQIINKMPNEEELEKLINRITIDDMMKVIKDVFIKENQRIFIASPKG